MIIAAVSKVALAVCASQVAACLLKSEAFTVGKRPGASGGGTTSAPSASAPLAPPDSGHQPEPATGGAGLLSSGTRPCR